MNYVASCIKILISCVALASTVTHALDNAHFYRAAYQGPEPRLEHPWLGSLEITFGGGTTSRGLNGMGQSVPLLDIYGLYNMQILGQGVPNKDITNPLDLILILLEELPQRGTFGKFSYSGNFSMAEGMFFVTQNLDRGFFLQLHIPVRRLSINSIGFVDLSPNDDLCPNVNTPQWQAFLANFDAILTRYNLDTGPSSESGVGDISMLVGWTINYENTTWFDYLDATLKTGVLLPTGKKKNEDKVFDISLGYNGLAALPLSCTGSAGMYEWITVGGYIEALFLVVDLPICA